MADHRLHVTHFPEGPMPTVQEEVPVDANPQLSVLRLDVTHFEANPSTPSTATTSHGSRTAVSHSPSIKANLRVAKKRYSVDRQDSLEQMETPIFTKTEMRLRKKGPSSPTTVLSMAGLFICGLLMMISGLLVLCQVRGGGKDLPFEIAGGILMGLGFLMLLVCLILQRKNLVKYVLDLNRDLYFLNIGDSYMWKLMFDEEKTHELPSPSR